MPAVEPSKQPGARVAICITTFRRRDLLRRLLEGISRLSFVRMPRPDILVVIVDNDAARGAADVCDSVALPWPAKYVVEPRRGIAQARNRAIREAEDPDFLAFLDDDEAPTPQWLDELLWTQACFDGDVVCGPVLPHFSSSAPEWVKTGRFFSKQVFATGRSLESCSTANVLISRKVISSVPAFDERFGLTGGEDTHFFLRVRKAGFNIICSGGAVVYESVPTSRASLKWLLRRAYQSGNSWVLCESTVDHRISSRLSRLAKASVRILQGVISVCIAPLFGKAALAQALSNLFLGVGMIAALAGWSFQSYQSAAADPGK
jgi:succinoglycan biosynthesis protein ExoM